MVALYYLKYGKSSNSSPGHLCQIEIKTGAFIGGRTSLRGLGAAYVIFPKS